MDVLKISEQEEDLWQEMKAAEKRYDESRWGPLSKKLFNEYLKIHKNWKEYTHKHAETLFPTNVI